MIYLWWETERENWSWSLLALLGVQGLKEHIAFPKLSTFHSSWDTDTHVCMYDHFEAFKQSLFDSNWLFLDFIYSGVCFCTKVSFVQWDGPFYCPTRIWTWKSSKSLNILMTTQWRCAGESRGNLDSGRGSIEDQKYQMEKDTGKMFNMLVPYTQYNTTWWEHNRVLKWSQKWFFWNYGFYSIFWKNPPEKSSHAKNWLFSALNSWEFKLLHTKLSFSACSWR